MLKIGVSAFSPFDSSAHSRGAKNSDVRLKTAIKCQRSAGCAPPTCTPGHISPHRANHSCVFYSCLRTSSRAKANYRDLAFTLMCRQPARRECQAWCIITSFTISGRCNCNRGLNILDAQTTRVRPNDKLCMRGWSKSKFCVCWDCLWISGVAGPPVPAAVSNGCSNGAVATNGHSEPSQLQLQPQATNGHSQANGHPPAVEQPINNLSTATSQSSKKRKKKRRRKRRTRGEKAVNYFESRDLFWNNLRDKYQFIKIFFSYILWNIWPWQPFILLNIKLIVFSIFLIFWNHNWNIFLEIKYTF